MNRLSLHATRSHAVFALKRGTAHLLAIPALLFAFQAAHAQTVYPTPDAAAAAFVDAVASNDHDTLRKILGKDAQSIAPPGGFDEDDIDQFLGAWAKQHKIVDDPTETGAAHTAHLVVGESDWPLPIPIVQTARGWHFDPAAARGEILTRRIGRNENAAMLTALAYGDAQHDYFSDTQRYAQRFVSTPGRRDGLYWPTQPGEPQSPLGPLAAVMGTRIAAGDAYHGYHYRILTAQGRHAPGGTRSYVEHDAMTAGFGLIAWPAAYGKTGLTTFIVGQDGQLYQKDLGRQTERIAETIKTFDPDPSWQAVNP